jgi:integrase
MATKLTDAKLLGLKAPEKGQAEVSDSDVPGLRIRIGTTGVKTFILRKRVAGRIKNITLGRYGQRFGLAEARKKARALVSDFEAGKPAPQPRQRGSVKTIRAMLPAYLDSKERLRSRGEIKRVLEGYVLPKLGDRFADAVTRAEVTGLIDEIAVSAPTMARAVHAQLSAFYTWAMPRLERLPANPCRDAGRPPKSKARDRVLTDDELRALWLVSDGEASPWGPALKLLMLTGARRDEVFSADRSEFDLEAREWTIPAERAKNGQTHIIPLSSATIDVVKSICAVQGSDKLFPTRTKAAQSERGPSGFSKAQARIRTSLDSGLKRTAGEHWTLHDIRRTVATGLQKLGVRFEVTEAVLNHVSGARGGIAGVYQRHDWKAEKRSALDAWARHLTAIVADKRANNVVSMKGRGA